VQLPKPPWYRRFGVLFLAANLVVAAVLVAAVVALWPPAAGRASDDCGKGVATRAGRVRGCRPSDRRVVDHGAPGAGCAVAAARTRHCGGRVLCGAQALAGHLVV
jgi:hypothetical protein